MGYHVDDVTEAAIERYQHDLRNSTTRNGDMDNEAFASDSSNGGSFCEETFRKDSSLLDITADSSTPSVVNIKRAGDERCGDDTQAIPVVKRACTGDGISLLRDTDGHSERSNIEDNLKLTCTKGDSFALMDAEKAESFYCPYSGCLYMRRVCAYVYAHIRECHTDLPGLQAPKYAGVKWVFKTDKGDIISFKENCRNMIDPGDRIIVESAIIKERFYCPYRHCNCTYILRYRLYIHIQKAHYSDFPTLSSFGDWTSKTPDGDILDFTNENCKDMLEPTDTIVVQLPNSEKLYCPYEHCAFSVRGCHHLIDHIRLHHYPECPQLSVTDPLFKTMTGEAIYFNNKHRGCGRIEEGDVILYGNLGNVTKSNGVLFFCPYQGCTFKSITRSRTVYHIRKSHYRELPRIIGHRQYITPKGEAMSLNNESCQNMLEPGDPMLSESLNERSFSYYCPYKRCLKRAPDKTRIYRHIRSRHCKSFPQLEKGGASKGFYATMARHRIPFDESSRNLLEEGEKVIIVHISSAEGTTMYCPYQNCFTTRTRVYGIYKHIRSKHDEGFPSMGRVKGPYTFKGPSGKAIVFDEGSRNTVGEGERIEVMDKYGRRL